MPKVSVVMPCLNMAKYMGECLGSVVAQTLEDIEVIIVDAGSTDGTLDIINQWCEKDGRIRLIHSGRKSYGYQVNLGIVQSAGEYIAIVDTDDRVVPDMYGTLYEHALASGADYVKGTAKLFYTVSDGFTYYQSLEQFGKEDYVNGSVHLNPGERPDLLTKDNFLWYGIFQREFLKDIRLHESPGAAFQDLGGLLQTQRKARRAVYLKEPFYEYRQDNLAASGRNPKGFEFVWKEYGWAEQFINDASVGWKAAFYRKFYMHTVGVYESMGASGSFWEGAGPYIDQIRGKLKGALEERMVTEQDFSGGEWESLQIFLEDGYGLYDRYSRQYIDRKKRMTVMLETVKNREIVLFGCGPAGMFVHAKLSQRQSCGLLAYCDNDAQMQGRHVQGLPVMSPLDAARLYPDACFLINSRKYAEDMRAQLIGLGVPQSRICVCAIETDMRLLAETLG